MQMSNAYQGAAQNALGANQPKELGVLQRVEGLRSGLSQFKGRLIAFQDRLQGTGDQSVKESMPAAGIYGNLSEAENDLRTCMSILSAIDGAF